MADELKPCPFCGGKPALCCTRDESDNFDRDYFVTCDNCSIAIHEEYSSEAIAAWNTRDGCPA